MSNTIQDGIGNGFKAKVDNTNKLATRSVAASPVQEALADGRAFRVGSGIITLTSANASAVLYLKNNDSRDMFIYEIITVLDTSAGGSGTFLSGFSLNPTGGTIQANTAAFVTNNNIGSNNIADVDATVGAEGKTATGGGGGDTLYPVVGRSSIMDVLIVPKGTDLAWRFTPPTGNTSAKVEIVVKFYFIDKV